MILVFLYWVGQKVCSGFFVKCFPDELFGQLSIYQGLLCGPVYGLSCRMFHVHVKGMWILLLLDEMLYKYQLSPSDVICHLRYVFPYWFSVWVSVHWCKWRVLKTPTIILLLLISHFMSINIYLIYWGFSFVGLEIHTQTHNCYICLLVDPLINK